MAAIKCKLCKSNTGYTDSTPIENRIRSFVSGGGADDKGEIHICSSCWSAHKFDEQLGRG